MDIMVNKEFVNESEPMSKVISYDRHQKIDTSPVQAQTSSSITESQDSDTRPIHTEPDINILDMVCSVSDGCLNLCEMGDQDQQVIHMPPKLLPSQEESKSIDKGAIVTRRSCLQRNTSSDVRTSSYKHFKGNKLDIHCANCGGIGHVYRNCNYPVTSYGVICFRLKTDKETNCIYPEYLMVQRKDSLNYVEFIRGKYNLENRIYILKMFSHMTKEEREEIRIKDFTYIWKKLWRVSDCTHFKQEFDDSKAKFDMLKNGYYLETLDEGTIHFDMNYILDHSSSTLVEPEWGFPKGRRNINESDMHCALREFSEETSIKLKFVNMCRVKPFDEVFTGTNKVRYRHVYYLACCKSTNDKWMFSANVQKKFDVSEIKNVKWFRYLDGLKMIRDQNTERKQLFERVNQLILKNICVLYTKLK